MSFHIRSYIYFTAFRLNLLFNFLNESAVYIKVMAKKINTLLGSFFAFLNLCYSFCSVIFQVHKRGAVIQVKALGILCLIDEGNLRKL